MLLNDIIAVIKTNTTVASVYSSGVGQVRMLKYFRYYVRALFSLP